MLKFIKNKFLFIVLISVVTLVLLVVGAVVLHKDNSSIFNTDGYIISTTTKKSNKYYFSANTKYKKNADDDVTFKDSNSKSVVIGPANFVHYSDGSIGYLKRGALVNLNDINSSIISYYNVNASNLITHKSGGYTVKSGEENINLSAFVGRISDDKYIVAGQNVSLQVPDSKDKISGDYFEILFVADGVVKIDNQEANYQVTAQDSYIYVDDNIIINLGNKKIYYNGDAKMLLSQITINGDENIDLDDVTDSKDKNGGGSGNGDGTGSNGSGDTDSKIGDSDLSDNAGTNNNGDVNDSKNDGTGSEDQNKDNGTGNESGDNNGNGVDNANGGANGSGTSSSVSDVKIELVEAKVTSTTIDASFQLNNASSIRGNLVANLINVLTGEKEYSVNLDKVNGSFKVSKQSLSPETEYTLSIVETGDGGEKQYFQKTFKTEALGISLEKEYATSDSLAYNVVFDENSDVTKVRLSITANENDELKVTEYEISANDLSTVREFSGLTSNSSYSVSIDTVWINNAAYSNVYNINRIDTTLKKTPELSGISVSTNTDEIKFNIKLGKINDPDGGILSYTYQIYLADDIGIDGGNLEPVYTVTKNDSDDLVLDLNQIAELKTGVDYRCKVVVQYNDNEMLREVETDYSGNFLIKSKPNFTFTQESATMNKVIGTLKLVDANCSVPVNGRSCLHESNTFVLRYYKLGEDETSENDKVITLNSGTLSTNVTFNDLSSDTTYVVKVYGDYYDDDNVKHEGVQLGDAFHIKTDESENIKLKVIGDNVSGTNKDGTPNSANVVTFDAMFNKPQDSTIDEEISSITLKLYSGNYNTSDKLIGTCTITDKSKIEDFFSSYTITNSMFVNSRLSNLDSLKKMIEVTNNSTGTLNGAYTVEVAKVLDSTGKNEIKVEDNIYTFKLTPNYYLDSRIETNPKDKYIQVSTITKEKLTNDEYDELSKKVNNLDDLNNDTIVGLTIENSLSDAFVDSAFTYEKVIVDYIIYNTTTHKEVKRISVDMGNKYQPKQQTIYLDSSDKDNGSNFTRGYDYKVSYELRFITEKGDNPVYTNDKFVYNTSIERQMPIYKQYISTSNAESVTYRYSISDIDNALYDKKLYYSTDNNQEIIGTNSSLVVDDDYHDIIVPIREKGNYSIYLNRKNTKNASSYTEISKYQFESEYTYNDEIMYDVINDNDNLIKIKLKNNYITDRAVAYRVVIKDKSGQLSDYVRYFLASKLNTVDRDTGEVDENGDSVVVQDKYIYIDYANINKYMGHDLSINVYDYYDSGLVGINQTFKNGLILENKVKNKYLNIYNAGVNDKTTNREDDVANGIYMQKINYEVDSSNMYLYNYLQDTSNYDPLLGTSYYSSEVAGSVGINYNLSFTNNGILFNDGTKEYSGYNAKVLKIANLKTSNDHYRFDSITPRVSLDTTGSTINSIKLKIKSTGVYGQFMKDGAAHNKFYFEIYSDADLQHKLETLSSDITIRDGEAVSEDIYYDNLKPDTTYYVLVYAYLDGKYTRLYDMDSKGYTFKTYEAKTLDANGVLEKITYSVKPVGYNNESSNKELRWRLKLKNTDNYKIRFELFDKNGKAVNFDGSSTNGCDKNVTGSSENAYINGCYIQVDKDSVKNINNVDTIYQFTGDDFVFGGEYYKLIVYAVPYTNNKYDEDNKLVLYENDSLSTTGDKTVSGAVNYNITIPTLEEATFDLNNTLISGYSSKNGYYIEFVPTINDPYFVMKYGKYVAKLKNEKGDIVKTLDISASVIGNNLITFGQLSANTLYYLELDYDTYRNNNGYTEEQKQDTTPFTDFIYTPIDAGITLGTITAQQSGNQKIILTYNGASNMLPTHDSSGIVKVKYTVSLKGGSSKANGEYSSAGGSSIFTVPADRTPRLTLDLSESNDTSFSLKSGNTYIISTQYWYIDGGTETQLTDQANGNYTFTTILNL